MDFNKLPNAIIIGAAKSGTTSLFEILAGHPSVFASERKELNFFSNDERFVNGPYWYEQSHFAAAVGYPVRLEASPSYLAWSEKTAPRIKELYADRPIKIIAIFRDPVSRAYSNYWHRVRMGHETLSFREALTREEQRLREHWEELYKQGNPKYGYFRGGCYASRLKPFLQNFPRQNFFFLLQDDLRDQFDSSLSSLLQFLGVDADEALAPVVRNTPTVPRNRSLHDAYDGIKRSRLAPTLRGFIPAGLRHWVRHRLLVKQVRYPPMEEEVRSELYERFSNEIGELSKILGRDLSDWRAEKKAPR